MANVGKAKQIGKYTEQGGAARSNNFTSVASPRVTPIKKKGAALPPSPQDILAMPQRKK